MLVNQLAMKYAQAMYELATEKDVLDVVETQLRTIEATIAANPDLAMLLYHPQVPAQAKKDTLVEVFGADLLEFVRNFLLLLVDKRRESALPAIIGAYTNLANEARNIAEADVITAMPLSQEQQVALAAKLSAVTKKNIVLKTRIDGRILGGIVVKIGDKLIDGSVARQLETMKAALLKTEVTKIGVTN
jgi:F-type H+-transporting ATPase subunit delta